MEKCIISRAVALSRSPKERFNIYPVDFFQLEGMASLIQTDDKQGLVLLVGNMQVRMDLYGQIGGFGFEELDIA